MVVVVVLGETDFARVRQPWPWGVTSQCTRQLGRRLQPTSQRRLPTPGGGGGLKVRHKPGWRCPLGSDWLWRWRIRDSGEDKNNNVLDKDRKQIDGRPVSSTYF